MNKRQIINLANIDILVLGLSFMFLQDTIEVIMLGIGLLMASLLNLIFNSVSHE